VKNRKSRDENRKLESEAKKLMCSFCISYPTYVVKKIVSRERNGLTPFFFVSRKKNSEAKKLMYSYVKPYPTYVVKNINLMQGDRPDISCTGLK
jgi:hypothetical protein